MPSLYDQILETWRQQKAVPESTIPSGWDIPGLPFSSAGITKMISNYQGIPAIGPGGVTAGSTAAPSTTTASGVPLTAPVMTKTDPYKTTLDNSANIAAIAELVNSINQKAQQAANEGRIPQGGALETKSSANINEALSGVVPADVLYQIGQAAAQRGAMSGSPLGASTNADYLRALGLTSLDLKKTGQDWLTAALSRNPAAPIFDTSKLVMTPAEQADLDLKLYSLANQLYLGQLDDSTRKWIAQLDADTKLKLQEMVNSIARFKGGTNLGDINYIMGKGGGGTAGGINWQDFFGGLPSGGGGTYGGPVNSGGEFDVVQPGMDVSYGPWAFGDASGFNDAIYGPAPTGADELFPGF